MFRIYMIILSFVAWPSLAETPFFSDKLIPNISETRALRIPQFNGLVDELSQRTNLKITLIDGTVFIVDHSLPITAELIYLVTQLGAYVITDTDILYIQPNFIMYMRTPKPLN